ncbi:MAG TPA: Clp protease ClpP [Candidatus Onthovicinus excrementipullorum]|nr:Clp protease ClpP [Candidatus Onthovicinus excrementipullorum]
MPKIEIKGTIVPDDDAWVYQYFGINAVYPQAVKKAIEDAAGQDLEVEINSGGGDVFAGSEIYTALRSYDGKVTIRIVGFAGSAASVIAMAGYSEMSPTAQMMVHNVSSYASGDNRDMAHMSEVLENANRAIAAAYVSKSGMSEKDALDMMAHETWLTAQKAKELKLVDAVMFEDTQPVQLVAGYQTDLIPRAVIDKVKKEHAERERATAMRARFNFLKITERK